MIGATGVMEVVAARFDAALPDAVRALRAERDLTARDLPDPARTMPYQPDVVTLGDYPCVFTTWTAVDQLDSGLTQTEAGPMVETFEFQYRVRVYALLRSDSYSTTERMTGLYEQALRQTLLSRRDLTPDDAGEGESIIINPVRVRSEPWDVLPDESRFLSAVFVEAPIVVNETVASPFGTVGRAEDTPVHPAFL